MYFRIIKSCIALSVGIIIMACNKSENVISEPSAGGGDTTTVDPLAPPATWQEHWFEHVQLVTNTFYDTSVAIYFDNEVNDTIKWPNTFLAAVWEYAKKVYGPFGKAGVDDRLYAIFHQDKYSGGHPSTYFDASHDNRNVIDCGSLTPNAWNTFDYGTIAIPTHEVGHIVEGASKGIKGSPAFPVWGDSKWMEIYIYDVYLGLGYTDFAQQWYDEQMQKTDDFPVAGTQWFKNWFYPIYANHGGTAVLNDFFETLAANFPTHINGDGNREYDRDMNLGEFVHFWSGAAHTNLKDQATLAFGWSGELDAQYNQALLDFPDIQY